MLRYRDCCLAGVLFMASALLDHGGGQNPEQATSGPAACEISHHGITGT
jgi:hypothetical protein